MIKVDLHSHTHFSLCGIHTVIELLTEAKRLGMTGLAVTDHGPALGGRLNKIFFERLHDPVEGIKLLKGLELNVVDRDGNTDCPTAYLPYLDIVLLGLHYNIETGQTKEQYTDYLIKTISKNSYIDIIAHPNDIKYLPDFKLLCEACLEYSVAIEINNTKTALQRVSDEITLELMKCCKDYSCPVVVNSDAHTLNELGRDEAVQRLLKSIDFPEHLIINRTVSSAFDYIIERNENNNERLNHFF